MKTIVQITTLLLLLSNSIFAQKRYLSDEEINDSEKIAEEIAEGIFKTEPSAYLESISLVNFEELEEDYFSVYKEASEFLLEEDAYEVLLILDETIETRYYNAMGQEFLKITEHNEFTFPEEIIGNYTEVIPACKVHKMSVVTAEAGDQNEIYKVILMQEEKMTAAYYKKGEDNSYTEIRMKDISLLQK
ncbi:hypothetical protein [Flammeovirga aprica]|uniref:Uncharacterized protein n=1 Tax=Flammeovirga aprica JL-4 TaxID=694437 RepID=A0A7X9RV61_9BACT|nr:hypothetical protein [Flammeovirga aprica]NME69320.1 hypothetical protein [Flammeovirga aprica JL-4]